MPPSLSQSKSEIPQPDSFRYTTYLLHAQLSQLKNVFQLSTKPRTWLLLSAHPPLYVAGLSILFTKFSIGLAQTVWIISHASEADQPLFRRTGVSMIMFIELILPTGLIHLWRIMLWSRTQ